jgi:hypothetical protein
VPEQPASLFHGNAEYSFLVIATASEALREAIQNAGEAIERWIAAALWASRQWNISAFP